MAPNTHFRALRSYGVTLSRDFDPKVVFFPKIKLRRIKVPTARCSLRSHSARFARTVLASLAGCSLRSHGARFARTGF